MALLVIPFISGNIVVREVFAYLLLLQLSKKLQWFKGFLIYLCNPGVFPDLLYTETLFEIRFEQAPNEVLYIIREVELVFLEVELGFYYLSMQLRHIISFEGHSPEQHCVETHTQTPAVNSKTCIPLALDDFRRDVSWSATLLTHDLFILELLGDPKIADLDDTIRI